MAGHTPQDAITYGAKGELPPETPAVTYGYALAQGRREYMEDRCVSRKIKAPRGKTGYFFAIFDGHGGSGAADWASERMSRIVENQLMIGLGPEEALREAFLQTDEEWIEQVEPLTTHFLPTCGLSTPAPLGMMRCHFETLNPFLRDETKQTLNPKT